MKHLRLIAIMLAMGSALGGCWWRSRPCHNDCYWDHGRKICQDRCR